MAAGEERGAQRSVVVHLAVEDDLHLPVLVRERLTGRGREIDDAQPAVREAEIAVDRETRVVRATDAHRVAAREQGLRVDGAPSARPDAGDRAHGYALSRAA